MTLCGKDSSSARSITVSAVSLFCTKNCAKSPTTFDDGVTCSTSDVTVYMSPWQPQSHKLTTQSTPSSKHQPQTFCGIMLYQLKEIRHPLNGLFFRDNLSKPAPERLNYLDFNEAKDDGVAVASAGPYANHFTPRSRQMCQHHVS